MRGRRGEVSRFRVSRAEPMAPLDFFNMTRSGILISMKYDLITIGDCVTDTFIELQEAKVAWDKDHERGELSMVFGDKIPYKSSITVPGVGNAANVAVGAARLGLATGFMSAVGGDRGADDILDVYRKERVSTE